MSNEPYPCSTSPLVYEIAQGDYNKGPVRSLTYDVAAPQVMNWYPAATATVYLAPLANGMEGAAVAGAGQATVTQTGTAQQPGNVVTIGYSLTAADTAALGLYKLYVVFSGTDASSNAYRDTRPLGYVLVLAPGATDAPQPQPGQWAQGETQYTSNNF